MIHRYKARLQRFATRLGFSRDWHLIALAAGIGSITAFGALGFMWLLRWGERSAIHLQQSWSVWLLPLLPVFGALLTGVLVHLFAREAKGHGVPEVIDAVYRKKGVIRPRVALVKSLASACTIGSGGSAGAEGPIIQIGSAIGSGVAQLLRISRENTSTLVGCGAAAGIASVFNAPIAGVFFVLEAILRDFSVRTFTPIVIASVFSTAVTQAFLGQNQALFAVLEGEHYLFTITELPSYLLLGLLCGLVAVGFIRALYAAEDIFDNSKIHPIIRPVVGAALLGGLGIVFLKIVGNTEASGAESVPPFFGNGYETIRVILRPESFGVVHVSLIVVLLMFFCKAIATCLTLGSGGSGGVFAPSLFLGATAGGALGMALDQLGLLPEGGSPATYALVGMAAVVAGSTHAPLTAILIVFEITRDVYVLLPIMLAAVISVVVAQLLLRDSIYTLKLRRRGMLLGTAADLTILRRIPADAVPLVPHTTVLPTDPVSHLLELNQTYSIVDFVVADDAGRYVGMVTGHDIRTALLEREAIPLLLVEEIMRADLPTISLDESLDTVLDKFSRFDVSSLAVLTTSEGSVKGNVLGLMTRSRLLRRYQKALSEDS
ncbi:MAG: chloride channel protein [Phycisphaeraceae bacterium]|nr:chloride channel protein [Phycisphaeraceae bacterium]MCB9848342.1 chloride channel protein [Phycisphaeraceae bacterium]